MREIKFRAWDGENMWYPNTKTVDGNFTMVSFYNNPKSIKWGLYDVKYGHRLISGEHDKLMQYTGLKDSEGVEIYEGDIIESTGVDIRTNKSKKYQRPAGLRYRVIWHDCRYMIKGFHKRSHKSILTSQIIYATSFIVIGNIHENPDLLNN